MPAVCRPIREPKRDAYPLQSSLFDFTTLVHFEKGLFDKCFVSLYNIAFAILFAAQAFLAVDS
eukprot:15448781-Heterocapsa_arctica.AAC.1